VRAGVLSACTARLRFVLRLSPFVLATACLLPTVSLGDDPLAKFASGPFAIGFVGFGLTLPLLRDGKPEFFRSAESLAATLVLTEGLKRATRVKRPDANSHDSFPSGHASAAFAIATMESAFHPKEAPLWYAGAAWIADSRLILNRHRISDVLAGAALGYLTARAELSTRHGWIIAPVISRDQAGVLLATRF
jgi:membrane-associated phospholipid phosphatase